MSDFIFFTVLANAVAITVYLLKQWAAAAAETV